MMMELILDYYDMAKQALEKGADINKLSQLPVREKIGRFKYTEDKDLQRDYDDIENDLKSQVGGTIEQ